MNTERDRARADTQRIPNPEIRGVSRMLVDAVAGVTAIVEDLHRNIAGAAPIVGASRTGGTRGITGLVYRSVRGVTHAVGSGLDAALARLALPLRSVDSSPRREAIVAALNGVLGDYLADSDNPLAIPMQFRRAGQPLVFDASARPNERAHGTGRLAVLVHGLCMNDLEWQRDGHDHGASLGEDLGHAVIHLLYNSGRHVSTNGAQFTLLLQGLIRNWPVRIEELVLVGHSMGGLLIRSACHYAAASGHDWPRALKKIVFLGTPHHGAQLERAGNRANLLLAISPYTAPFVRLGELRSAGIQDLRWGNLRDEDWQAVPRTHRHDARTPVPLPEGVRCFAIAASRQRRAGAPGARTWGDGLVSVSSALGVHRNPALSLAIPAGHRAVCYGTHHLQLLGSVDVYERMRRWLSEATSDTKST